MKTSSPFFMHFYFNCYSFRVLFITSEYTITSRPVQASILIGTFEFTLRFSCFRSEKSGRTHHWRRKLSLICFYHSFLFPCSLMADSLQTEGFLFLSFQSEYPAFCWHIAFTFCPALCTPWTTSKGKNFDEADLCFFTTSDSALTLLLEWRTPWYFPAISWAVRFIACTLKAIEKVRYYFVEKTRFPFCNCIRLFEFSFLNRCFDLSFYEIFESNSILNPSRFSAHQSAPQWRCSFCQ